MTTEEKDRIFSSIQDIVNNNPVIVVGCGASMGFGIPGMWDLAEAIKKDFSETPPISKESQNCIKKLIAKLDENVGLEDAMLSMKCTEEVENRIISIVWNEIKPKDSEVFTNIIQSHHRLPLADLPILNPCRIGHDKQAVLWHYVNPIFPFCRHLRFHNKMRNKHLCLSCQQHG